MAALKIDDKIQGHNCVLDAKLFDLTEKHPIDYRWIAERQKPTHQRQ